MAATEIDIPDFLCSKKGEREDHGLSSEILEEKVKPEIRSQVAETVNKQLETDVLTNESGTFFQALSVPVVSADDEGTPESCKAATTEDQTVAFKENSQEDIREQKPEERVNKTVESHVESVEQAVKSDKNEEKLDEEAIVNNDVQTEKSESPLVKEACEVSGSEKDGIQEGLKDTDSFITTLNENELVSKEEIQEKEQEVKMCEEVKGGGDDVISSQNTSSVEKEESEKCDNGEEEKREQSVNEIAESSSEMEQKEDTEEIKSNVEREEKAESQVESAKNEVKSDDNEKENFESPSIKEVCEETGLEKVEYEEEVKVKDSEYEEGLKLSDKSNINLNEKEIASKVDVTNSQNAASEDMEETTIGQHVTTYDAQEVREKCENGEKDKIEKIASSSSVETKENEEKIDDVNEIVSKEENQEKEVNVLEEVKGGEDDVISSLNASSDDIKETVISPQTTTVEVEDKLSDAQEDKSEEKPKESVSKEMESSSKIDQEEEDIEEIKPSVETEEKTEQQVLLHAVTTDDCITTQTESHVDTSEHEVKTNEAIQSDDGQNEIFNKLNENEIASKVEDQEKEQEVISSQDATYEDIKESIIGQHVTSVAYLEENQPKEIINEETEEKSSDAQEACEEQKPEENVSEIVQPYSEIEQKEDTEETKPSFETEEKTEQQELLHADITDDVTTSQTKSQVESAEPEVKNDEAIQSDDGQKENFNSPLVKEVCEETGLEKIESEEGLKLAESSNNTLNESDIASKIEDQEKEQEAYVSTSSQDATCEDIKATTISQHVTTVAYVDEEQALSSMPKEILKEIVENKSTDAQEETEQYEKGENDKRDQDPQESVGITENTEEIKPSVETYETKEQVEITRHEEAIESDDGQKEKSKNLLIKEACEETDTQKVEFEGVELSNKDESHKKEQEPIMSEQDQGEDTVRYSQDATSTEDLQVKNYDGEDNEPGVVKTREYIEEDTEEIIYSETKEMEEKIDTEAIVNDYGETKKSESPLVEEVCEVIGSENVESEEGLTHFESSSRTLNQDDIKEENQEKEQEPKEVEGGGDDVISSSKDIKETSDAHEDKTEQRPEESINKVLQSCSDIKQEEDTEEIKPSVEIEQQGLFHAITSQTESHIESAKHELKSDELIQSDDCQKEKVDNSLVDEVYEETESKKVEYNEEVKETANENDIANKVEEVKSVEPIESDDGQKETVDTSSVNEVCEEIDSKKVEYSEEVQETINDNEIARKVEEVKTDELIQSDDGQKEIVDSSSVNEVCEEIDSKKVEYSEEVQETTNDNETVSKVEEVKTDELIQSDDGKKEIVDSSSVNEVCEEIDSKKVEYSEEIKETTTGNEIANKVEEVKSAETIQSDDGQNENIDSSSVNEVCKESDSQKVEYSQEVQETTKENEIANKVEEVKTDEPIQSDDGQKETVDSSSVNEVCEETGSKKVEYSQEVQKTANESEITGKVEEVKTDEPIESDDGQKEIVDSSSVNEVCEETDSKKVEHNEEVKETTNENEIASKVEQVKSDELIQSDDGQKENVDTSSEVCEETDSKNVEYSEEVKQTTIENEIASKVEEVKSDELIQSDVGQKENVDTSLVNEVYEENDSKKGEYNDEVKETSNENDIATDEPIPSDDGHKENVDSSLVNEICEETDSKKAECSQEVKETTIENEIENKVEDEEKQQEVYMPQDEKCEDIKEQKVGEHVATQAPSSIPKDIIKEETEEKSSDAQEEVCISEQMESQKETMETEEKNEEFIESDAVQMEKTLIPSVNEGYEETTKEVCDASEEGVKAIETFKDEDEEEDQEVNKSTEGQGIDNVTSSQVAALEDDLQNESNQDKGKEPAFVETRVSIEEDTEEIKSSVETIEDMHAISTDIRSSTQTETLENEEKIEEEAIVNDDGQTEKSESLLVKEVCEVISSGKAESELNENEIVSKEEIQEKEQELKMSEEVKGVEDSNMKEECLPTITHVDEEQETETKEISSDEKIEQITEIGENISLYVKEEVTQEDQTNSTEDCSEISKDVILTKEVQKGTDDLKEQVVEEDNHSTELQEKSTEDQKADVESYLDPLERDESPKQALESVCDVQTPEVVADSEDSKVKEESIECTDEMNGEEEHEVKTNEIASAENLELHGELKPTSELVIEEDQVEKTKSESEQSNIMENVILTEKDLADETTTSNDKEIADEMSSEIGQPKGQIVEEIQEGPAKTTSEIIQDEITKEDEILSHDTTTKDEKCFQDERTREIEPVEEHNDDLDEVSMQKSTDLNETTTEVKPQEDIVPSSSLVTSTEDTPNSEKPKAENDTLPIEDLESVYDEQIPEVVSMSEDSNLKEDYVTSATATYVDEEKETVTKEISSDEKTEQITEIDEGDSLYEKGDMKENVAQESQLDSTEDCSQISKDVILTEEVPLKIQKEKETDDLKEQIAEKDTEDQKEMAHVISYSDPIPVAISEVKTEEISSTETPESKQVAEYPSISSFDAAVIEENLELHGELKPTSESVIEEDKVKETKSEQEQSDITSENIMKDTSEKDLVYGKRDMEDDVTIAPESQIENTENQNETIKNVILTDEVAVDTENQKENNEVKEVKQQVSEEDICPTELDQASTSNQKELADEVEYSKPTPSGNNEVKEVKAESPTELENIQAAETPETTLKMEMKEEHLEATNDKCETLMDGSLSEKKLESMIPPEELTSSTTEDQTYEQVQETENTLEEDANKEKETVGQSHEDEPMKTTSDSISSFTEQSIEVKSEECKDYADIHKLEEKPTEVYEIKSEVAEIVPRDKEVSETLPENVPEASLVMLLEKNDSETTTAIEKITPEVAVIDVEKQERALDYTEEAIIVDEVSTEECSEIQQQHISKKEAILEENQSEQKKEADENIEREIPTEKESVELDAYVSVTHGTAATEELEISQKDITDDIVKISQNQPEIPKYEDSACIVDKSPDEPHQNESVERKLLTGNKDEQHEQKEPTEKPLIAEPESKASGTEPQCSSEVFKEEKKMSDEKEKSQTVLLDDMLHEQMKGNSEVAENLIKEREIDFTKYQEVSKEEAGDKGAKTDEENEEEDDKDNQMIDDPVMVEASKDIDVKVHKKSHNILSGVGSKVKHSIAKVKKAITGKSSSPKPPSPKEKDQVIT